MESALLNFQPLQILCLEHDRLCLYVEVIQVASLRQLCWVRPLALGQVSDSIYAVPTLLHDLRQCADLLWPATAFRAALDTEVLPLLAQLDEAGPPGSNSLRESKEQRQARQQLQAFMQQVWQADQA